MARHGWKLTPLYCLFPGQAISIPDAPCLHGSLWRTMTGQWSSMQVHSSSISDTAGWQSTYSRSLMNIQFTPTSRVQEAYVYTGEQSGIFLSVRSPPVSWDFSLCSSSAYFFIRVQAKHQQQYAGPNFMHVSLEVSTRRHFFPDTLSKPTQSCTVCAKEKSHLSFVSTNTLIWGFHSWVSSRYPQKPTETQEMNVGPSISPSSAEAHLTPHGLSVFISQWGHA